MAKRKIVIDDRTYHWSYHIGGGASIWDGRKKHEAKAAELGGTGHMTPRYIRYWIERFLLKRDVAFPKQERGTVFVDTGPEVAEFNKRYFASLPPRPGEVEVPVDFVQPEVYLIYKTYWDDDAGSFDETVVAATLDPMLAKTMANEMNAARTAEQIVIEDSYHAEPMKLEYKKVRIPAAALETQS